MVSINKKDFYKEIEINVNKFKFTKEQYEQRTPVLFKIELEGNAMIALAFKMYCGIRKKNKMSMRSIQEAKNKHLKSLDEYKKYYMIKNQMNV